MRLLDRALEKFLKFLGYRLIKENRHTVPFRYHEDNRTFIPNLEILSDQDVSLLNELLPWSSFLIDSNGRRFGKPFSEDKRNLPEAVPDNRIIELDRVIPLKDMVVLEVGCYEGVHTSALCGLAKQVIAIDARIEHVVKTLVRCSMFNFFPKVYCVDLENDLPVSVDLNCDVLHHVGVLYHLSDPVRHLKLVSSITRKAVLLDTHIAPTSKSNNTYKVDGISYRYYKFKEHGRLQPFAGTRGHAKWLFEEDLIKLLTDIGFQKVDIIEKREERNGPRLLLLARK